MTMGFAIPQSIEMASLLQVERRGVKSRNSQMHSLHSRTKSCYSGFHSFLIAEIRQFVSEQLYKLNIRSVQFLHCLIGVYLLHVYIITRGFSSTLERHKNKSIIFDFSLFTSGRNYGVKLGPNCSVAWFLTKTGPIAATAQRATIKL